jgi:predicted secreted protein
MNMNVVGGGILAAILAGLPGISFAGDIANIQPIGFSADGKVFAFQEFGQRDEDAVPYSNTYFIDTDSGANLEGTPFRTELTGGDASLSTARRQNLTAARSQMDRYDLLTNPGLIAAFNPPTELGSPMKTIRYTTMANDGPPRAPYTLLLGEARVPVPENCANTQQRVIGFTLQMIEKEGAPQHVTAYEDKAIPAERGCPVEYRMGGALVYQPATGNPVHIALVLALSAGSDGNTGRWIAVPVHP